MIDSLKGQKLTHSALLKKGRVWLFSLGLLFTTLLANAQSSAITDLKEDQLTNMSLYFYPSTLRMVNLNNNEEFNRLIQDIEKLIFFKMNGKFENIDMYNLVNHLQSNEDFEEYVVVDGPTKKFYLLGREKPTETVGIALLENEHFVFDVAGSLELKELPKLYQYISENDSTFQNKFSQILGLMEMGDDIAD
ncbi:MAG: hypothetical protein R8N23_08885 [Reichenbachiella sp.]|uniref:DUF4252 domain-containing protein n=1 Tax=Reichenbachiella sp. TaxID=2184521 RepID=UPI002965DC47|nr:hypothetical protein [Reichenbachiella sp.]MDW3209969.1 hypothetical protein [Reichenbachiella sp.]